MCSWPRLGLYFSQTKTRVLTVRQSQQEFQLEFELKVIDHHLNDCPVHPQRSVSLDTAAHMSGQLELTDSFDKVTPNKFVLARLFQLLLNIQSQCQTKAARDPFYVIELVLLLHVCTKERISGAQWTFRAAWISCQSTPEEGGQVIHPKKWVGLTSPHPFSPCHVAPF